VSANCGVSRPSSNGNGAINYGSRDEPSSGAGKGRLRERAHMGELDIGPLQIYPVGENGGPLVP